MAGVTRWGSDGGGKGTSDGTHLRCYPSYASGAGTSRSRATGGYAVRSLFPVRLHSLVYYKVRKKSKIPESLSQRSGDSNYISLNKIKVSKTGRHEKYSKESTFVISGMARVTRWGSDGGDGGGRFAKIGTFGVGKAGSFAKVGFANMTWRCLQAG